VENIQITVTFDPTQGPPADLYSGELDLSINDPSGDFNVVVPLKAGT
jgi:hypothetical protein